MSVDLSGKMFIVDEKSALHAVEQAITNGDYAKIQKQVERVIGQKVSDPNTAAKVLSDRMFGRAKRVDDKINSISREITSDPVKQAAAKEEIEKMVRGELRTEREDVNALVKTASVEEIIAKKVAKTARGMVDENPEEIRSYREEKVREDGLGEGEEGKLLNRKEQLAEEVASAARTENQEQPMMEKFRDNSGAAMAFGQIRTVIGLGNMPKEKRQAVLDENNKINSELSRFKSNIPTNAISRKVLALDDVSAHLGRDKRSLGFLNSYQGGGSFLVRFKMTFYNLRNILMGRQNGGNGFLMMVGGQPTDAFMSGSMGLLLNGNLNSGLRDIFAGMAGKGINAAFGAATKGAAAKLAAGAVSGPLGWVATAANFLKKFLGGLGEKLGPGIKKGLGDGFNKGGGLLVKGAMALVTVPIALGALMGTGLASTVSTGVIAGTAGYVAYNQYATTEMVSGLVSAKKGCDSRMEYVDTSEKPPIECKSMSQYNTELQEKITTASYQTRCAVAAAAQYLTIDFPYWISYGWAQYYYGDGLSEDWCGKNRGMDCNSFIVWAYRQGGFAVKKRGRSETWRGYDTNNNFKTRLFETERIQFNQSNCARIEEVVKPGDIVARTGHKGMVIGVESGRLQIAQEADYPKGLMMCYINPCTGTGKGLEIENSDGKRHACNGFTELWSMDNFFDYYVSGTSINGFTIEPNSEIKSLVTGNLLNKTTTEIHDIFNDINDINSFDTDVEDTDVGETGGGLPNSVFQ